MYGYENFEAAPITTSFDGAINQLDKDLERRIKEYLAIRCGLQEIFTYPWMDEQYVNAILQDTTGILSLSTPPPPTEKMIRSSLLPNLCKAVVKNERYFTDFSLFETAQVFRDENYTAPYDEREKLPSQRKHLGAAFRAATRTSLPCSAGPRAWWRPCPATPIWRTIPSVRWKSPCGPTPWCG